MEGIALGLDQVGLVIFYPWISYTYPKTDGFLFVKSVQSLPCNSVGKVMSMLADLKEKERGWGEHA